MKKDDEFALKNEEYDDDARAVKESELLPIFEVMDFSGDIQPLDDFEIPEPVPTDLQSKKKPENKVSDKKEIIKEKIPSIKGLNKTVKRLIVVCILIIGIGAAGFAVYKNIQGKKNDSPVGIIYTSDKVTYIKLENENEFKLEGVQDVKVSEDGMKIFYSTVTPTQTGKYDVRYIDVSKRDSLRDGGGVICTGVDDGWQVNKTGSFVCYSTTLSSVRQCYFYSTSDGKAKQLPIGVDEMFLPATGDVLYFTRKNGTIYSLHRIRYGEEAANVASNMSHVKFCDSEDAFEIIYTVGTGTDNTVDIYSVTNLDPPSKICSSASEVYLNDYVYGGNLYYFKSTNANVDWHDFIDDPDYESDLTFECPVEGNFMKEYGFIYKRYILDKTAYNQAMAEYEEKVKRDSVRAELDKIDFGLAFEGEYSCNVYNHYTNKILATGVSLENVIDFAVTGTPRLILRKSVIKVEDKYSMNDLVNYSEATSAADTGDFVRENIKDSYETSEDCLYSWFDGNKVVTKTVTDYKDADTKFVMADGLSFFALSGGKLYCTDVENSEIVAKALISENVSDCEMRDDFLYYKKNVLKNSYDLFRYSAETGEKCLKTKVAEHYFHNDGSLLFLSNGNESNSIVTLGKFADETYLKIDKDVLAGSFVRSGDTIAYIRHVNKAKYENSGDMYLYSTGKENLKIDNNVTDIKYVKDGIFYENKSKS